MVMIAELVLGDYIWLSRSRFRWAPGPIKAHQASRCFALAEMSDV